MTKQHWYRNTMLFAMLFAVLFACAACIGKTPEYDQDLPIFEGCKEQVAHPFGSHPQKYTKKSILPEVPQDEMDAVVAAFYDGWKQRYLKTGAPCAKGHYYIKFDKNQTTVSEAHGYGMLTMVYMAGYDPDAQKIFDGMYRFFRAHPSSNSSDLLAWRQDLECKERPGDASSATDGDLDIAYALLLADRQWGSAGEVNYRVEARKVIRAIMEYEVNASSEYLLIGDWATSSDVHLNGTRGSDFMPGHLEAFTADDVDGLKGSFAKLTKRTYQIFKEVRHPETGLIPDFIVSPLKNPQPGDGFLEHSDDRWGYNSCRIPWRIGVHYLLTGSKDALDILTPITQWIEKESGCVPEGIKANYSLDGVPLHDYEDMCFIAPFAVGAMIDAKHQSFLNNLWESLATWDPWGYYADSLRLLSMIAVSGNWWTPELSDCDD
jgi:endo-1,4-beta-D-glucanase Y